MHMRFANTFGLGELTAAIVEIPDILGKTNQLQISMISKESNKLSFFLTFPMSGLYATSIVMV